MQQSLVVLRSKLRGIMIPMFPSKLVGIDIGSHSVKLAEVSQGGMEFHLSAFGIKSIPTDSIVLREIIDRHAVVESLKEAKVKGNIQGRSAVVTLSGPGTFVKKIQMKGVREGELPHIISWEAAQWLPFPIDEVELDYEVLAVDEVEKKIDILLVAAKKSMVHSYLSVVREAGFDPKVVDIDALALQNLYLTNYGDRSSQVTAILNIGESLTTLHIFQKGGTLLVKDFLIGGAKLTKAIQNRLKFSETESENIKISSSSGGAPADVREEIEGFIEEVSTQISSAIKDWYSEYSSVAPIGILVLTGGSSQLHGLSERLSKTLSVRTETLSTFKKIHIRSGMDSRIKMAFPMAAVSIGLAVNGGAKRAKY